MLPLTLRDHGKVCLELVVKSSANCKLSNRNHQCVMLRFSSGICCNNTKVVHTNVILQGERDDLLVFSLEMSPTKIIDRDPCVPVYNSQPQIPCISILQVLESISRDDYPEIDGIRKIVI